MSETDSTSKKWGHLRKILERSGPFDTENFTPSPEILEFLMSDCKILVIGEIELKSSERNVLQRMSIAISRGWGLRL